MTNTIPPFTVLPRGTEVEYYSLGDTLAPSRAIIEGISLHYTDYADSEADGLSFRYMIRRVGESMHFHVDHSCVSPAFDAPTTAGEV